MKKDLSLILKKKAYYFNSISQFIIDDTSLIIGHLTTASFEINKQQTDAWEEQINVLKKELKQYNIEGSIVFEYNIIRLGKRIDVVLLIKNIVFAIEFKNGKNVFTLDDIQQAEDYAINIKNFHKESKDLYVCPILVVTKASNISSQQCLDCYPDKQIFLQKENLNTLMGKINEIVKKYGADTNINLQTWLLSPYYPTPTIIETAIQAYSTHDISEIANSEAGQKNISNCIRQIEKIITYAKNKKKKCICFVTGVPGAGKTLVGLDLVAKNLKQNDRSCIYLSGNKSLVDVLKGALIKSVKKEKLKNKNTKTSINALIQGSYAFKQEYSMSEKAPCEHIIVFDEAQRVWNSQKMKEKHNTDMNISEPYLLYQIMNRHTDWAVIICLVGLGQDIYDGEVGISEWFRCGIQDFQNWELFYSNDIFNKTDEINNIKKIISKNKHCHNIKKLHLQISIRSFRAEKQSLFVDDILKNNIKEAKFIYKKLCDKYPIYITRSYQAAKQWVQQQVRGSQKCGVLASSSAQRLKPEGIYVFKDIDVKNWFLASNEDLRSSNKLEIVASEFKVQGLEIDWAVVCWDLDLRVDDKDRWGYYFFRGTKWMQHKKNEQKRYLLNSYRVLLTRARQGMVIFIPRGVPESEDKTRIDKEYDKIFNYLVSCGVKVL